MICSVKYIKSVNLSKIFSFILLIMTASCYLYDLAQLMHSYFFLSLSLWSNLIVQHLTQYAIVELQSIPKNLIVAVSDLDFNCVFKISVHFHSKVASVLFKNGLAT